MIKNSGNDIVIKSVKNSVKNSVMTEKMQLNE